MGMFAGIWILLAALHVQGKTPPPPNPSYAITHTLEVFVLHRGGLECVQNVCKLTSDSNL